MVELSIRQSYEAMRTGELSAVELAAMCLQAIDTLNTELNAFSAVTPREKLLDQAKAVDRRRQEGAELGYLAGIPIAAKDIFGTSDLPTTASSKVFAGYQTGADAHSVASLRNSGALIIGKAQTHEFAYGPTTVNEFAGPSRNPWNSDHVPGGSSGGSAIAVATGMCLGATGSDTGGSIRHPSAFCGVTGLKPTYGLVSRRGVFPLSWSLDHVGPIARTVDDIAFMLQAMAGFDEEDPGSADVQIPDYIAGIDHAPREFRIGIPKDHYLDVVDPDVRKSFDQAIQVLADAGGQVKKVSLPHIRYALGAELAIISAEASAFHRETMKRQAMSVSSDVRRELDAGMVILATDYILGQRVRRIIAAEFSHALREVDVLASPTIPIPAPKIDQVDVEIEGRRMSVLDAIWRNTYPSNLTGLPSLSVPCGFSGTGLPIGLQLIGRGFDELTVLQLGHRFQSMTDWHQRLPVCR